MRPVYPALDGRATRAVAGRFGRGCLGRRGLQDPGRRAWEPTLGYAVVYSTTAGGFPMMRGGLLWLLGIPLPIILILFFLGYLH
jgi:hypothetical protein